MRTWFMSRLMADLGVQALVDGRVSGSGSIGVGPESPLRPFIAVRAGSLSPAIGKVVQQPFYVYAHVVPGSALAADTILAAVRAALKDAAPTKTAEGLVIMECRWRGESDDLFDDAYGTTVRYATYGLTSSP
jgi:hypothetical protein